MSPVDSEREGLNVALPQKKDANPCDQRWVVPGVSQCPKLWDDIFMVWSGDLGISITSHNY